MHSVYVFKRLKKMYVKRIMASLERELEATEKKLNYLADLDQGSAHYMMEQGFMFEHDKLVDALNALHDYLESRIDNQ